MEPSLSPIAEATKAAEAIRGLVEEGGAVAAPDVGTSWLAQKIGVAP